MNDSNAPTGQPSELPEDGDDSDAGHGLPQPGPVPSGDEEAQAQEPVRRHPLPGRLVWVVALGAAAIIAVLDQATKAIAVAQLADGPVSFGFVTFTLVRNPNAAFGIPGFPGMFLLITVLVVAIVARLLLHTDRLGLALAYGLVVGGALGNGFDRVFQPPGFPQGAVVDFVSVGWFPVFNVADSAISVGAAAVVVLLVLRDREMAAEEAARHPYESVRPETPPPRN